MRKQHSSKEKIATNRYTPQSKWNSREAKQNRTHSAYSVINIKNTI